MKITKGKKYNCDNGGIYEVAGILLRTAGSTKTGFAPAVCDEDGRVLYWINSLCEKSKSCEDMFMREVKGYHVAYNNGNGWLITYDTFNSIDDFRKSNLIGAHVFPAVLLKE